jgi:Domain of unknown function (DUF4157)
MRSTLAKKTEAVRRRRSRSMPEIGCSVPARATSRFLPIIQAKLRIGAPNDKYEQEADRVANQVMSMREPDSAMADGLHSPATVQRACATCSGGRGLCPECEEELQRQRKEREKEFQGGAEPGLTPSVPPPLEANIRSVRSRGEPLSAWQRGFFEPRFGMDFSAVRVHANPGAGELARSLDARAFTVGSDIVFGRAEYNPGSSAGLHLLAHELTHVVQQGCDSEQILQREPASGTNPEASLAPAPTIASAIFLEHPSELYHGFDPNGQLKKLAVPEGQKRKLAVEAQPSGTQPNYVTTDPSLISITPIADGVEVASLSAGKGAGGVPGVPEIQATDGINVLDRVGFFVLPRQQVSVGYHFMSDPPREGPFANLPIFKNLPVARTARNPGDEIALTEKLNEAWEPQANIHFTIHSVQSDTFKTRQINPIKGDDAKLEALFRPFASGAQMEVFLVWELSRDGDTMKDTNGRLVQGTNFTILEDDDAPDGFDLAHEAGHFLGYTFHTKTGLMGETTGSPDRPRVLYDWATRANIKAGKI